jgi:hypothetical protein
MKREGIKMPNESSNALPAYRYGDPADVVEYDQMDEMGCWACSKKEIVLGKLICKEEKNANQKGVPNIGHKCRWFIERV